ncbi:hypothetical protein SpCBS45565_g02314 [Spizellomyces sp. 'palustris']|nr:hypothetical protein SpCBS45565_g02314 [Spizellomyces sp. 'palustris']
MPSIASMTLLVLLPALAVIAPATAIPQPIANVELPQNCTAPTPHTCTFYTSCLEVAIPCGPDGYAIGYGNKFCSKFQENADKFTDKGEEWMYKVMSCLQESLVPKLPNNSTSSPKPMSCSELKSFAYSTHPNCYLSAGVCTLHPKDWIVLLNSIGIQELFTIETIEQALAVAKGCGKEYIEIVKDILHKHKKGELQVTAA